MSAAHGSYWDQRKRLDYYYTATEWAKRHTPEGGRILDVGGGTSLGCRYLDRLPDFERTVVELKDGNHLYREADVHFCDFMEWEPDGQYDTVMCLQCVEHVREPWPFIQKMREIGSTLILSVPFMWPAGLEDGHLHDPIDRIKLKTWVGREPNCDKVSGRKPWERLIGLYL